ncbi:MAG: DMT family transporter [Patescibacteria group bacterium]
MTKENLSTKGAEALFGAAMAYALTGIFVREVSPMWTDKAQVAVRFGIVLFFLAIYQLLRKNRVWVPSKKLAPILFGGLLSTIMILSFTIAIGKTTIANVLFVFYAANMITSFLLGTLGLKEHVSRAKLIALGFAILGLAVYSGSIASGNQGIILSIIAGVAGGTINLINKQLTGVDRTAVLVLWFALVAALSSSWLLLSGDQIIRTASLHLSLLTIVFALVIIVGAFLTLYGFQHFDVNIGSVIMSTELVFAAIMAYFLFNEVPQAHELAGGAFILIGSIVGSGIFDKPKSSLQPIAQPD